jgi:two-component system sensor histidine kinase KdpD
MLCGIFVQTSASCRIGYNLRVRNRLQKAAVRLTIATLVILAIAYLYFSHVHVNAITAGFTYLVAVLVISATWGLPYALFAAVVATLAYDYFFLPPIGKFTIADPQNWVALAAFFITAIIASHLAERARRETLNANQRRHDVERLYALSQELLVIETILELVNAIPKRLVDIFRVTAAAIYLNDRSQTYYSNTTAQGLIGSDELRSTALRGEPAAYGVAGKCFMPLHSGVRPVGAFGVVGSSLSFETLEAIGSLIAIAVEHTGTLEKLGRSEAARETDKLRTVLLDSLRHDFRTPLTSILASAKSLLFDDRIDEPGRKELLTVINEEGERLNRMVGEAAELAQLEAHQIELELEERGIAEAIEGALEESRRVLQGHPVKVELPADLPKVRMDLKRIQQVLTQLLDNAGKYAAQGTSIHITAEVKEDQLVTSVADQGPGIDDFEQGMIFDKFYRGRGQRQWIPGTGMGLAIAKAIVEAHHGTIGVVSQLGHGSVFYFTLPVVSRA